MRINSINAINFKGFDKLDLQLDGKSTVIFGVNGAGKTSILAIINYLFRSWMYRLNPAQGNAYRTLDSNNVRYGSSQLKIAAEVQLDENSFVLTREYVKARPGKGATAVINKKEYAMFLQYFNEQYMSEEANMPIFINYGTNRSVLDIPLRIRRKHEFSKLVAIERAIENTLDFRTFFEWYRNQEDIENEIIRETGNQQYEDKSLHCVRVAVETMLGNVTGLRVRRNPLRMVVKKANVEVSVEQLSDGEKCTLALLGDLARRLALANPNRDNPLEGDGVVLIDELELHMHPAWQRRILNILTSVFPNIQFIVTTHSPQVLGEVDDSFNIIGLTCNENSSSMVTTYNRMDVFDSSYILEEFMGTRAINTNFTQLVNQAYREISEAHFDKAQTLIETLARMCNNNNPEVVKLHGELKRSKYIYEKNH